MWRWWLLLFLLLPVSARADITHVNYLQTDPTQHYVAMYDVNGNALDVQEGDLKQFGSMFYYYGTGSACGYISGTNSPFCGITVYSSPDLVNWTNQGTMFDPNSGSWQTKCGGSATGGYQGCWRPHVLYNAANNNYVLSFYQGTGLPFGIVEQEVLTCTTPTGGCTNVGPMPSYVANTWPDSAIYQDDQTGAGYMIWAGAGVAIQPLNASYTDITGSAVTISGLTGESGWFKHIGSHFMVGAGTACPNCAVGATTSYMSATSALGPYSGLVQMTPTNACSSQEDAVITIVNGAGTNYYYIGSRFDGSSNFGQAAPYWQPLTVTGDLFNLFTCSPTITVAGVTSTGTYPTPAYGRSFDINQMAQLPQAYFNNCRIETSQGTHVLAFMQQFTPTVAPLDSIGVSIGKGVYSGVCTPPSNCALPDGSLEVDVTTIDGSGNPATILGSKTYPASALQYTAQFTAVPMGLTLTPGTTYAAVVKEVGMTNGCYTVARAQPASPLVAGAAKYQDGTSAWNVLTNEAVQLSTFPNPPPKAMFMHLH